MSEMTRYNPFREMLELSRAMDDLFYRDYPSLRGEVDFDWKLPLDVVEREDSYLVRASVPGIDPNNLEITYLEHTLTIKGETQVEESKENERYHMRERRFGRFLRSISLLDPVAQDKIEASYENGVLELHLPKAEEARPRRISVLDKGSGKRIEAKTK